MFANACTDFELELDYPTIRNKLRVESLWSPSYSAEYAAAAVRQFL
jgi:hypothetical protein